MSKKSTCQGGLCLLNPLDLPIVCQQCPRYDRGLLRKLKNESSPLDDIVREPQPCPICGNIFFDRANKVYCSPPCCKKAYRLRKLARTSDDQLKEYEWRECEICGKTYYPHTDLQKTCGGACSEEYMRRTYKRGVGGIRSKHLSRLEYNEEPMKNTIILNPIFTAQLKRHECLEHLSPEDVEHIAHYLSANLPWWTSLSQPRQGALINIVFSFGIPGFLEKFRTALQAIRMCRWGDAKSAILSSRWATNHGTRAVELARQIESGVWQRDPMEQLKQEQSDEHLEQGVLS